MVFCNYLLLKLSLLIFFINFTNALDTKILLKNLNNQNLTAPTKLSNCKARLDDNSIIDLTSLDNPKSPR